MDFLDDEPSPEERQAMLVQLLKAKMGGQAQPQLGPSEADFARGWGNMNMRSGDRVLGALGQSQIQQGQQLGAQAHQANQASLAQALQAMREKTRRAQELSDTASQRRYQDGRDEKHRLNELEQARIMAGIKAAEKSAPKPITAAEAAQIGTYGTAAKAVDQLGQDWDAEISPDKLAGLYQYIPGTDAKQYANKADVAAQVVGGILEEGKLGEADLPRYKAMMPQPGDSKETKAKKVAAVRQMIGLKRAGKIQGLGQAGFEVGGFNLDEPPPVKTGADSRADGGDDAAKAAREAKKAALRKIIADERGGK